MKGKGMTLVQAYMLADLINASTSRVRAIAQKHPHHPIGQLKLIHMNDLVLYASSTAECMEILMMWSDEPYEELQVA